MEDERDVLRGQRVSVRSREQIEIDCALEFIVRLFTISDMEQSGPRKLICLLEDGYVLLQPHWFVTSVTAKTN